VIVRSAFRCVPREGESACGDAVHVRVSGPTTWIAMFDGLGHGPHAALASTTAVEMVCKLEPGSGVLQALARLDEALRPTRGAAALLCRIADGVLSGCIVGNVELRARPSVIPVVPTAGILGQGVRRPRLFEARPPSGTRLLAFSDGLDRAASLDDVEGLAPAAACDHLMRCHRRPGDDTAVLVAELE
jgi:negative regulator of sigma-B (phosphoserine phosphatase)